MPYSCMTHGTLPEEASGRRGMSSDTREARRLHLEGRSEQVYRELVQERFHRAREYLSELYPLHYRLEVLEDIFSLLFLTSESLKLRKNGTGEEGGAATSNGHSFHRSPAFSSRARSGSGQAPAEGDVEEDSISIASLILIRSRHRFVVGEREAEGLIDLLQDCMVELSSARFTLLSSQPPAAGTQAGDRPPTSLVRGSIPSATLQQRSMCSLASYSNVGNRSGRRVLSVVGSDAGEAAIIPRMLASPSYLLRTCLRHANYLRAHVVVRLFGLAGQFSEALVHFSERYELVCQELCSPKPGQGSASASSALTPHSRPTPSLLSFSSASQVTGSSHLLLAVLVMVDIVYSANVEGQLARNIVEQASNRCQPNQSDLLPMRSFGKRRMSNDKKLLQFFNTPQAVPLLS